MTVIGKKLHNTGIQARTHLRTEKKKKIYVSFSGFKEVVMLDC